MHGTPCFAGTRVAVRTFFDHLEAGYTIDAFLEQFPTVRREQVLQLLALVREDIARRVRDKFGGVSLNCGRRGLRPPHPPQFNASLPPAWR